MNPIIKKIILLLLITVSLIVALLVCNFFLNQTHFIPNPTVIDFTNLKKNKSFKVDSQLIYTYSNDNEYRNPLQASDPHKKNIAFVGDSITWSYGASDSATYPLTFKKLYDQDHSDDNIIVNNFGIPGYNIDQEYLLIKQKILTEYHPNVIIWNLNINDMWDSNYYCLFKTYHQQWIPVSAKQNIYYWYIKIKEHLPNFIANSNLFNFIWNQFVKSVTHNNGASSFTFGCSSKIYDDQTRTLMLSKLDYFINDLKHETKERNIILIITIVPYQQYLNNQGNINQISPDYFYLERYLSSNNSINFIDLNKNVSPQSKNEFNPAVEYFLDASQDASEYGWRHPNQKMYDLMASNLEKYVQKNHLF